MTQFCKVNADRGGADARRMYIKKKRNALSFYLFPTLKDVDAGRLIPGNKPITCAPPSQTVLQGNIVPFRVRRAVGVQSKLPVIKRQMPTHILV